MPIAMNSVDVVIPYILVEENEEFETMWRYFRYGGNFRSFLMRRSVHTKVFQATLTDGSAYPGARNPGKLAGEWQLASVSMSAPVGVRLQRTVREVWVLKGQWEFINE